MSDVVPELLLMAPQHGRTIVCADRTSRQMNATIRRAAAEITRLRAQVASLTAAVEGERERCARFADELGDRLKATGHKAEAYGAYRVAAELDEVSAAVIRSGT